MFFFIRILSSFYESWTLSLKNKPLSLMDVSLEFSLALNLNPSQLSMRIRLFTWLCKSYFYSHLVWRFTERWSRSLVFLSRSLEADFLGRWLKKVRLGGTLKSSGNDNDNNYDIKVVRLTRLKSQELDFSLCFVSSSSQVWLWREARLDGFPPLERVPFTSSSASTDNSSTPPLLLPLPPSIDLPLPLP